MKKILVVTTNVSKCPNLERATGLWLGEAVHFVDAIQKEGHQIDYVSPKGGYTPIDPHSLQSDQMTELDWKYYEDQTFMDKLGTTLAAAEVNAENYDAIYYTGGHGVMWDYPENESLQKIASTIYQNGGIVSAVCHGSAGLVNIKDVSGQPLIANKKVSGFTNTEEAALGLENTVPFLTEDALVSKGANYVKGDDWAAFAVADNRVVTGQNPASGGTVAAEVLAVLNTVN